jgi:hypothetical protein
VRFLANDKDTSAPLFEDDEINGLITMATSEGVCTAGMPYHVAAILLQTLGMKYAYAGEGIDEKVVDDLRIRFGLGGQSNLAEFIEARMMWLRSEAARLCGGSSALFRAL